MMDMSRRSKSQNERAESEVIATFGGSQLVKHLNGKVELRGGSVEDQRAARDWVEKFMPDVAANLPRPSDGRKI
jgi:hypothetical protein